MSDSAMSDSRPVIGICTALARAKWGVWERDAALLAVTYIDAIQRAGGMAVMIPPDGEFEQDPDQMLDLLDGLILAGGNDIDPACYGADRHPETHPLVPERDRAELALATRAVERDLPVLGICRGMQLINVAYGGTLRQHLPEELGHEEHRRIPGSFVGSEHDVRLAPGSLVARAAGEELHATKSHHHQGVAIVGDGLEITGRSTIDDLPEAIEAPDRRFMLGVQWHPEADEQSRVVAAIVEQARDYRSARGASYPAARTASATRSAWA
ncbi:MAG TPA: gamma-glutamyl-gamma-aminobutyrate hydrolase family protein [Solirubrobacteraceae bacterium]|jgi:putative glutamine amidotransferase